MVCMSATARETLALVRAVKRLGMANHANIVMMPTTTRSSIKVTPSSCELTSLIIFSIPVCVFAEARNSAHKRKKGGFLPLFSIKLAFRVRLFPDRRDWWYRQRAHTIHRLRLLDHIRKDLHQHLELHQGLPVARLFDPSPNRSYQ